MRIVSGHYCFVRKCKPYHTVTCTTILYDTIQSSSVLVCVITYLYEVKYNSMNYHSQFGGGKPAVVKAPTGQANEASVSSVTTPPSVRPPPSHKQSMKGIQKASTVDIHVANERPPG